MPEQKRAHGAACGNGREAGFALVLAIMSLMLLTFLGLTLATTTSTELQIATNYRWSQQALYNAEAGIEAGKLTLEGLTSATTGWTNILPGDRGTGVTWTVANGSTQGRPSLPATSSGNDAWGNAYRNWENAGCDQRGGNVGYGVILSGMQNATTLFTGTGAPQNLNGAVTVWIRRGTRQNMDGTFVDDGATNALVLTAEGVAPFSDGTSAMAFAAANKAVKVLEASVLAATSTTPGGPATASACSTYSGQGGGAVSNSGFWGCGLAADLSNSVACDQGARDAGGTASWASNSPGTCTSLGAK
jgi:PilX N-terminal